MTMVFAVPVAQVCTFMVGCVLIHAARERPAALTHGLVAVAVGLGLMALLAATTIRAGDEHARFDEITVYAALSHQQPQPE